MAHTVWLQGVVTEAFGTNCTVYMEDCGADGYLVVIAQWSEHWQLKPENLD